jgi:hypothetical protein
MHWSRGKPDVHEAAILAQPLYLRVADGFAADARRKKANDSSISSGGMTFTKEPSASSALYP